MANTNILNHAKVALGIEGEGNTVLVSGVTGFVGTAVALAYVQHGFRVHATARSQDKADEWLKAHPAAALLTKFFIVRDVAEDNAFDEAIKGVHIVAHTASPFHYNAPDPEKDMLIPAINGTLSVLRSAAKEASVKRVVVTSSFAAVVDLSKGSRVGYTYSHEDWNPATYEEAKNSDNPAFIYCASKVLAEKAAWDFVKDEKPGFELSTICPPLIFGPPQQVVKSLDSLNTSSANIFDVANGKNKDVPDTPFPVGTDVRDIAAAHVLASTLEVAKGQRYLTIAFHYSFDQVAALLRRTYPNKASLIPEGEDKAPAPHFGTDSSKAEKELGLKWIPFEQSTKDTVEKLWQLQAQLDSAQ